MSRSVFIMTPVYEAPVTQYTVSLYGTAQALERAGIASKHAVLPGCCYLDASRNKLAQVFLESGLDDLLFVDADVGWHPPDVVRLCQRDEDIVGGCAPFKDGSGKFPCTVVGPTRSNGLAEATVLPTQMLKIRREVFEKMLAAGMAPKRIDTGFDDPNDVHSIYYDFFSFINDDERCRIIREDVSFCAKWRSLGGKLWLESDMTLTHYGKAEFTGNFYQSAHGGIAQAA